MISGRDLRSRRLAVGISQFQFAREAGVSSALVSSWELDKAYPQPSAVRAVVDALAGLEAKKRDGTYVPPKRRSSGTIRARRATPVNDPDAVPARTVARAGRGSPTVLTAFSGCGGMAEGFRMGGFSVEGYIEVVAPARATFQRNFPRARCLGEDIRSIDRSRVEDLLACVDIDVLAGGPPCQGFSLAGRRDRDDPRNHLFRNLLELAEMVRPKVLVMENVRLLLSMKDADGGLVIDRIVAEMDSRGYIASINTVNAQDYGVPQWRERVFIVATRRDGGVGPLNFPPKTHGDNGLAPLRTFRDATVDLAPLESGEACGIDPLHWAVEHPEHVLRWLRDVPEGMSAHDNADPALRPASGYNTTYKRLRWDEPASTVGTTFGMISASRNVHPTHTRSLTVREAARVQTFPDDYVFEGNWGAVRTMIGNAVPPRLAQALATEIGQRLGGGTA